MIKLFHPVSTVFITQKFGLNPEIYAKFGMKGHPGIDYRTRFLGSPLGRVLVSAAMDGVVIEVDPIGKASGYGKFVRLRHEKGEQTIYAHLEKPFVVLGQMIGAKNFIGLSGNTGFSTGPHLHFGFRPNGWEGQMNNGYRGYVDPLPYLI